MDCADIIYGAVAGSLTPCDPAGTVCASPARH